MRSADRGCKTSADKCFVKPAIGEYCKFVGKRLLPVGEKY